MEITSFVLGMLTIVAVIILTVIVVGMVKINQLTRKTESLEGDLKREIENVYNNISRENEAIWRQFEITGRDITMVEKTLMNRVDDAFSYTDSRIDKIRGEQGSKQILKG